MKPFSQDLDKIKLKVKVNLSGNSFSCKFSLNGTHRKFCLDLRALNGNDKYWDKDRKERLTTILVNLTGLNVDSVKERVKNLDKIIMQEAHKLVLNGQVQEKRQKYLKKRWFKKINAVVYEALENGVTKEEIHEAVDMAQVKQILEN